jgi:hypothetical protein
MLPPIACGRRPCGRCWDRKLRRLLFPLSLPQPHARTFTVLGLARDLAARLRPIAGAIVVCEGAGDVVRFVEIACHAEGDDDRNPPCEDSHDDVFLSLLGRCLAHRLVPFLSLTPGPSPFSSTKITPALCRRIGRPKATAGPSIMVRICAKARHQATSAALNWPGVIWRPTSPSAQALTISHPQAPIGMGPSLVPRRPILSGVHHKLLANCEQPSRGVPGPSAKRRRPSRPRFSAGKAAC